MKISLSHLIATFVLTIMAHLSVAQKGYTNAMQSNLENLYEASTQDQYDASSNKFLRIGDAEKNKWLPYYYAALAQTWKSTKINEPELKDKSLDGAQKALDMAMVISDQSSESIALQGFIHMLKISVDPVSRGQTLSAKAFASYGKALELDPDNPRAKLFLGQMKFGMAQFFGSSTEEACTSIAASVDAYNNVQPKTTISPSWGRGTAEKWLEKCQSSENGQ